LKIEILNRKGKHFLAGGLNHKSGNCVSCAGIFSAVKKRDEGEQNEPAQVLHKALLD
jgi:hypothetical protein